jgi:hypothetical protein
MQDNGTNELQLDWKKGFFHIEMWKKITFKWYIVPWLIFASYIKKINKYSFYLPLAAKTASIYLGMLSYNLLYSLGIIKV